ncbi:hypothetical protein pb186bvf_006167 [Paramecium bursaria]
MNPLLEYWIQYNFKDLIISISKSMNNTWECDISTFESQNIIISSKNEQEITIIRYILHIQ